MATKINLKELEGKTLVDFLEFEKDLLPAIQLAMNSDPSGKPDVIDKGWEVVEAAKALQKYSASFWANPIVAEDIGAYLTELAGRPYALEKELRDVLQTIKEDPGKKEFKFRGKTYTIGAFGVTGKINALLEEAGSKMRFILGVNQDQKPFFVFGELSQEKKTVIRERRARIVAMDRPQITEGISKEDLAVHDSMETVFVLKKNLRAALEDRRADPPKIYDAFFGKEGGVSDPDIDLLTSLLFPHEERHFAFEEEFGYELKFLRYKFLNEGDESLRNLEELYADLATMETIPDQPDPLRAFQLWFLFRVAQTQLPFEEVVLDLLLSAASLKEGKVAVDWQKLKGSVYSLKAVLKKIFKEIRFRIRYDTVAGDLTEDDRKKPELIEQAYSNVQHRLQQELLKADPTLPELAVQMFLAANIVHFVIGQEDPTLGKFIDIYRMRLLSYLRRIDNWTQSRLGVDEKAVPFQAPKIELLPLPGYDD